MNIASHEIDLAFGERRKFRLECTSPAYDNIGSHVRQG
jgi:hypothetical protein